MKKKSLGEQLQDALKGEEYLRGQCDEKRRSIERLEKEKGTMAAEVNNLQHKQIDLNGQLFEIIRWFANKDTAMYPFRAEKGQQDGNNSYRGPFGY